MMFCSFYLFRRPPRSHLTSPPCPSPSLFRSFPLDSTHPQRAARQVGWTAARRIGGAVEHRFGHFDAVRRRDGRGKGFGGEVADIMVGEAVTPGQIGSAHV